MTQVDDGYDVIVVGAGSAGTCSAIAAARAGARTLLVDRLGFPGGTSTAVLDTFYAFFTAGGRKVVSGLPDEPVRRLRDRECLVERQNTFGSGIGYTYNPEILKIVWAELLAEAGVCVALHTLVVDATFEQDRPHGTVTLASPAGLRSASASAFVDASGDASLVALGGGRFQDDDELRQPATLTFRLVGVDLQHYRAAGRKLRDYVAAGRAAGHRLEGNGGSLHASGSPGIVHVATTRIRPPDPRHHGDQSRVELEGLVQVDEWFDFLRAMVPGFERAQLATIGPMSGVRETRRVLGHTTLHGDDVRAGRHPPDEIARCGAPIEDLSRPDTHWVHVGGGGDYGIPWATLLPRDLPAVAVAGRCLSATHEAHASARSMATCMAMGQAAGAAAALAVAKNLAIADVPVAELRYRLVLDGADLFDATSPVITDTSHKEVNA